MSASAELLIYRLGQAVIAKAVASPATRGHAFLVQLDATARIWQGRHILVGAVADHHGNPLISVGARSKKKQRRANAGPISVSKSIPFPP